MSHLHHNFRKEKKEKRFLKFNNFFALFLFLFSITFSQIASATLYAPGVTLEPDCAPGSVNCGVATFSLNSQTNPLQTLVTGSSGTDFSISSVGNIHTFNLPSASPLGRGLLTSSDWNTFNSKQEALSYIPLNSTNNLSDVDDVGTTRTNLGLGTLAIQNGTFSGTSSGANTGDQTTSGTSNRITVTNGSANPVIDISSSYVGQPSITTLGTITIGTWSAGTIPVNKGGTGSTNGSIGGTGPLSFTSASFNGLTLDSGTTGGVNIGTGTSGTGKIVSIGNTNGTTLLNFNAGSGGIFMTGAGAATAGNLVLCIDASNQIFLGSSATTCDPSSARFKHDIADIGLGLDAVNALRPVSYKYNANNEARLGFIAEEAAQVDERLIERDKNGEIQAINPDAFTPILTRAIQEMSITLDDAKSDIKAFSRKVHTDELCLTKSDGKEVCINGDQLNSILQNASVSFPTTTSAVVEPPAKIDLPLTTSEKIIPVIADPIPIPAENVAPESDQ